MIPHGRDWAFRLDARIIAKASYTLQLDSNVPNGIGMLGGSASCCAYEAICI
jgi:hypothetical protein